MTQQQATPADNARAINQEAIEIAKHRLWPLCVGKRGVVITLAGLSLALGAARGDFEMVETELINWYGEDLEPDIDGAHATLTEKVSQKETVLISDEAEALAKRFDVECVGKERGVVFVAGLTLANGMISEGVEREVALGYLLFLLKTFEPIRFNNKAN